LAAPFIFKASAHATEEGVDGELSQIVDPVIRSVMDENNIPGMAVGLSLGGKRHYFNYGIASRESRQRVTEDTIFELGSISKIFTATLASYAHGTGTLSLSDKASKHLPALKDTSFDEISILDLGTYTAGGLPLQFPDEVMDYGSMLAFYRNWRPSYQPGSYRQYSNPSIGLFGYLAAKSMNRSFEDAVQLELLPNLGLTNTFINVPSDRMVECPPFHRTVQLLRQCFDELPWGGHLQR
jgi:beta-lactamase class C